VDIVALEMLVLRVLSAEKSGKQSLDIAGLLKIRGSEIQQRYTELMMLAAGPYSLPFIHEAMEAGWQGDAPARGGGPAECVANAPLAGTYFNMRKTTIYGGSNEVQRNIVSQTSCWEHQHGLRFSDDQNNCATPWRAGWTRATDFERRHALAKAGGATARSTPNWPNWAWPASGARGPRRHGHGRRSRHGGHGRAGPRPGQRALHCAAR
jgi:hypothetical protein